MFIVLTTYHLKKPIHLCKPNQTKVYFLNYKLKLSILKCIDILESWTLLIPYKHIFNIYNLSNYKYN